MSNYVRDTVPFPQLKDNGFSKVFFLQTEQELFIPKINTKHKMW